MTDRIDLTAKRRSPIWVWALGWTLYTLLDAFIVRTQSRVAFGHAIFSGIADHLPMALLSIVVWRVSERLSRRRVAPAVNVAVHVVMGLVVITVAKGTYFLVMRQVWPPSVWQSVIDYTWMYMTITAVLEYCTVLGIMLLLQAHARERERDAIARDAELAAVRAQLHPHFLLNSLNSIVALIDSDPPRAREIVMRLSELLQSSFRRLDEERVPLDREIDMVRAYLDIEQVRFGPRLQVRIDVDQRARDLPVPPLVLQPIVENAVKHGVAPHARNGEVTVSARCGEGGRLLLEVRDSGGGADPDALQDGGRGLSLTRRRLENVYPSNFAMTFERLAAGFAVRIDLPAESV
jgi:LytS/YehU family sensor histidine kinase